MAVIPAFFGLLLVAVVTGQQDVVITPTEAVRRVGEDLRVLCKVPYPIDSCRMEVGGTVYRLRPGESSRDVVYAGNGFESGECGAELTAIQDKWNGDVSCSVPSRDGSIDIKKSMQLIVARAPQPPLLLGDSTPSHREGARLQLQCSVAGGRPAAELSWFLDSEPLTRGLHEPVVTADSVTGLSSVAQNMTRELGATDSGRRVVCRATHRAWDRPMDAARQIIVNYPPRRAEGEGTAITIFGLALGAPGRLNVTVTASPQPEALWTVGDRRLQAGQSSDDESITALSVTPLGGNLYNITLLLSRVTKEDVDRAYYLTVSNEMGRAEYAVTITTMAEPAGVELDAGAIVGIVVGVLAVLVLVFLVVFALATRRWCFAGRGREAKSSGESAPGDVLLAGLNARASDTESAGAAAGGATSGRSRLAALGARVRAALPRPRPRDKGQANDSANNDEKTASEEKKGVVYAELALGDREGADVPPAAPPGPPPADYAEIVYTTDDKAKAAPPAVAKTGE